MNDNFKTATADSSLTKAELVQCCSNAFQGAFATAEEKQGWNAEL
eukprot:gene28179-8708_t